MSTSLILILCSYALACLCFASAFIVTKIKNGNTTMALIFKILASLVLVLGGMHAFYITGSAIANMFIVIGLILALIGEILYEFVASPSQDKGLMCTQMAARSLSAEFYLVALILIFYPLKNFALFLSGSVIIAIIFAIVVQLLAPKLKLDFTGYRYQVGQLCLVTSLVAFLGLGISFFVRGMAIFTVGAILVLASQILGYFINFSTPKRRNLLLGLDYSLYYVGELLIMAYMFFQIIY